MLLVHRKEQRLWQDIQHLFKRESSLKAMKDDADSDAAQQNKQLADAWKDQRAAEKAKEAKLAKEVGNIDRAVCTCTCARATRRSRHDLTLASARFEGL
jgi:hypothetical protein